MEKTIGWYKMKNIKIISLVLCICLLMGMLCACSGVKKTKNGRLDYFKSDMSKIVNITKEDYKDMVATIPLDYLVTDSVVDAYIKNQLFINRKEKNGTTPVTDRAIEYGDTAYIYYEGFVDGVAFSGGSNMTQSSPYALSIGAGEFIDGFEEALIGVIPNQTSQDNRVDVNVTFPEYYPNAPDLQGKPAVFKVYVVEKVEYEVPELNDQTIKEVLKYEPFDKDSVGLEAEYRMYVRKMLELANESGIQNAVIDDLLDQLLEKVEIKKVPKIELDYYEELYIKRFEKDKATYEGQGYVFKDFDDFAVQYMGLEDGADWRTELEKMYTDIIKSHLICHAIAQLEGMELTTEEYEQEIQYYINQYATEEKTLTRADVIETIGEYVLRESAMYAKVCSMLYSKARVIYE